MKMSTGSILRAFSSVAVLVAAATEPSSARRIESADSCFVCGPYLTCPAPHEMSLYDPACQTMCGYGTYAGACSVLGSCYPKSSITCYLIE